MKLYSIQLSSRARQFGRNCLVVFVLILSCSKVHSEGLPNSIIDAALKIIYPNSILEFSLDEEGSGHFLLDNAEIRFRVCEKQRIDDPKSGDKMMLVISTWDKSFESVRENWDHDEKQQQICIGEHAYLAMVATDPPHSAEIYELDQGSEFTQVSPVEVANRMNLAFPQAQLETGAVYFDNSRKKRSLVRRFNLIDLEGMDTLARITTGRDTQGAKVAYPSIRRQVRWTANTRDGMVLQVTDLETKRSEVVPYANGAFVIEAEDPWVEIEKQAALPEIEAREVLVEIVDAESGEPIESAQLTGHTFEYNLFRFDQPRRSISGITDSSGHHMLTNIEGGTSLIVFAKGYYKKTYQLTGQDLISHHAIVHLRRATPYVPMGLGQAKKSIFDGEPVDIFELMVDLDMIDYEVKSPLYDIKTDEPDLADLIVTANLARDIDASYSGVTDSSYLTSRWDIRIQSQNGWQIAPGPSRQELLSTSSGHDGTPHMAEAPENGYSDEQTYKGNEIPGGFYIYNKSQERYGRIKPLNFSNSSKFGKFKLSLSASCSIQLESAAGRAVHGEMSPN